MRVDETYLTLEFDRRLSLTFNFVVRLFPHTLHSHGLWLKSMPIFGIPYTGMDCEINNGYFTIHPYSYGLWL
jgi:hypothetical protein